MLAVGASFRKAIGQRFLLPTSTTLVSRQYLSSAAFQYNAEEDDIARCNEDYKGHLEIQTIGGHGFGLVSQKAFQPGDLIVSANVVSASKERDSHSIQKDWNTHITVDLPAILINHSCDANVGIRDNEDAYDFFALKEIKPGDELTWDYEASEYELSASFKCVCGSPSCRSSIIGFKKHGDIIKKQYGGFYADYLKETK